MKNKKGNIAVIAIIMIIVAITAGVIGWKFAKKSQTPMDGSLNKNLVVNNNIKTSTPAIDPKSVVKSYVDYTLAIPAKYDLAKQYLTSELQTQFSEVPGFVPKSYGIQEVPNSLVINDATISNNSATVRVIGQYLTTKKTWDFSLVVYNSEWRISKITNVDSENNSVCTNKEGKTGFIMHDKKCYVPGEYVYDTDCKVSTTGGCESYK